MMDLKGSTYWNICGDVFNFLKRSLPVLDTDEYWDRIVGEADQLFRKYEETDQKDFAKDQILSVINEMETISKRKRGDQS